jgi:ABC-type glycerol-3-phosphate transport system substrate-binding protein
MQLSQSVRDKFRLTGLFSALITAGLLATACGTTPTTSKAPQLRVWRVDQSVDVVADIRDTFLETNKTVQFSYQKKSIDGYELAALKSLTARNGPDVWSIPSDWIGDHVARIGVLPDNFFQADSQNLPGGPLKPADYVKQIYPAGIVDQISIDGKVYGLPTGVDTLRLYVNRAIFDDAFTEYRTSLGDNANDDKIQPVKTLLSQAPSTWSDLVDQTTYLTKRNGNTITRSAISLGTADNSPNTADILQLLMLQNGADITTSDHTRALFHIPTTSPSGITQRPGENALDFLASFSNSSKQNYTWNPSMPQALDAFGQGKVAMVIAFSDFGKQLKVKYPKLEYEVDSVPQISVAPLQQPVNLIKFWTETVPRVADTPSVALAFMKDEIRSADSIAREAGLGSPFLKTLNSDATAFPNRQILTGKGVYKKSRDQFDMDFRQMIIDVSQNGLTPSQALDSGAEKINDLLKLPND